MTTNDINKIYLNGPITVTSVNMTSLLFNDSKAVSKTKYSVLDQSINVVDPVETSLCFYQTVNNAEYYEYYSSIRLNPEISINTIDRFGNHFDSLKNKTAMIFIDGYKLLSTEFEIDEENGKIIIIKPFSLNSSNTVIIYLSKTMNYNGNVLKSDKWNNETGTLILLDYSNVDYVFFLNGYLVTYDKIRKVDDQVYFSQLFKESDILECYKLPDNTSTVFFTEVNGYFSYGPVDDYGNEVPEVYTNIITFEQIARLAIDDLRKGFLIKEDETVGNGELIVIDEDYETYNLKCLAIVPFLNTYYNKNEYYVQVPEARSILKYASEYDLKGTMFPELLGLFQRLLLDETYDSIQRLKNIRSINKVDSVNINALIQFLGMDMRITNLTLEQKHALLEELNNFYKIVGTRSSYSFYNLTGRNTKITRLEQLFTPIRDYSEASDNAHRYVTFRTPEELGAVYKKKYEFDKIDYGYVDEIANYDDILTNQPRAEGQLDDNHAGTSIVSTQDFTQTYLTPVVNGTRKVYINNEDGTTTLTDMYVPLNPYVKYPKIGPNQPTIDYGSVTEEPTSFIDYGLVTEEIKGKWIQWMEWDRPENWYPTNHVEVAVEVPPTIDYTTFMKEFMQTFYEIASTVVYIHRLIEEYSFNLVDGGMSIVTTQVHDQQEYTLTADPRRQAEGRQIPYPKEFIIENQKLKFQNQNIVASVDFRTIYTDDEEYVDSFEQVLGCSSSSDSTWLINSDASEYSVSQPNVDSVIRTPGQNGNWSYVMDTMTVENEVTFDQETGKNIWKVNLPNNIKFNRYNEEYSFDTIDWQFTNDTSIIVPISDRENRLETTLLVSGLNNSFKTVPAKGTIQHGQVVIQDVDYVVFRYKWTSGKDLDTDTKIVNAYSSALNNKAVGWNRNRAVPTSSGSPNSAVLYWGGDNTGTGEESILFNVKYLKENYYNDVPALTLIDLMATWYSTVGAAPVIQVEAYKGGTMSLSGYSFVNNGGEKVGESSVVTTNMSSTTHVYNPVAYASYDKLTDTVTLSLEPINTTKDLDYLIFEYKYTSGKHLDTFTRITNSSNSDYNIGVGYYASTTSWQYPNYKIPYYPAYYEEGSAPAYDSNALVQWCRHNRAIDLTKKEENVLINLNTFTNPSYNGVFPNEIIFDLYCAFLGSVSGVTSSNDVSVIIRGYKGGNIIQDPNNQFRYINVDDQGHENRPTYEYELPLENVYIDGTVADINKNGYSMIPEETSLTDLHGNPIKGRLRRVMRVIYNQSTNRISFQVVPKQE